jgi:hypothetical protein
MWRDLLTDHHERNLVIPVEKFPWRIDLLAKSRAEQRGEHVPAHQSTQGYQVSEEERQAYMKKQHIEAMKDKERLINTPLLEIDDSFIETYGIGRHKHTDTRHGDGRHPQNQRGYHSQERHVQSYGNGDGRKEVLNESKQQVGREVPQQSRTQVAP